MLQVMSPVRVHPRGNQSMFFSHIKVSLSSSFPTPSLKINKTLNKKKKKTKGREPITRKQLVATRDEKMSIWERGRG